ncbi:MAG TPA: hypothetical protein VLT36_09695, partial [Candidatus Dormibacteraeota bacterium]|nr:hypothetical protein [Candidatus Dormibacteraeota bacterium]
RNYGGMAGGFWMQLQSAYDHIIVSTCYEGEFNVRRGRAKVSHRFNKEGRIDFVEMKFLRSLDPLLNGALRKLLTVKGFQTCRKDWGASEAYVLDVLPREMTFLYPEIFRFAKDEVLAWTVNVGHRLMGDLLTELQHSTVNGFSEKPSDENGQFPLHLVRKDEVAMPILQKAAQLQSSVEVQDSKTALIRYVHIHPRVSGN